MLTGNLRYLEYWRTGQVLFQPFESARDRLMILEFLFHQAMAPRPIGCDPAGCFSTVPWTWFVVRPDDRLGRIRPAVKTYRR